MALRFEATVADDRTPSYRLLMAFKDVRHVVV